MEETFELPTLEALVFEYDPATRRALTSALLDYGFEVTATAESTEALDRLRLRAPHVVFVDFDAPTLGGSCFAVLVGETCAEVSVPTLDDEPVTLKVPAGTRSGRTFRVRGRGVRTKRLKGDLLVTVEVFVPESTTQGERSAVEALADAMGAAGGELRSDLTG